MKKNKRKPAKAKKKNTAAAQPSAAQIDAEKRRTFVLMRNGAIGVIGASALGIFGVTAVRATLAEQDLAQIGNGLPSVVQIHDPGCPLCNELQRNTRRALRQFEAGEVNYVVADINTETGRNFADQFRVQHVTLLLFDAEGQRVDTLAGVRSRDELEARFATHVGGQ